MSSFICFGKKDICDRVVMCVDCEFCNGKGGTYTDSEDFQFIKSVITKEIFEDIDKVTSRYLNDADYSGGELIYDIEAIKQKHISGSTNQ